MRAGLTLLIVSILPLGAAAQVAGPRDAPSASLTPRPPMARPVRPAVSAEARAAFTRWRTAFRGRALAQGVPRDVFDAAIGEASEGELASRAALEQGPTATRESRTGDLASSAENPVALAESLVEPGRRALDRHRELLSELEDRSGVEAETLVALWGLATRFGAQRPDRAVVSALADQAHLSEAGGPVEAELVAALKLLELARLPPETVSGAVSGQIGHLGLTPLRVLVHGVDLDGDGRSSVWADDPAESFATAAAFLTAHGWAPGLRWGREAILPDGFDLSLADSGVRLSASEWSDLGVRAPGGKALEDLGRTALLMPAGGRGPAFLVTPNHDVLARYDTHPDHALAAGYLSQRLAGADPITTPWPQDARPLDEAEREELQRRLTGAGFDTRGVDGRIGPLTVAALRAYQDDRGLVVDGVPSLYVLRTLRAE